MDSSWRDGLAFCAMIHHFRPNLIKYESLKSEDILANNELAYKIAEEEMGIPSLLDPQVNTRRIKIGLIVFHRFYDLDFFC